jgi:hypothetical protein
MTACHALAHARCAFAARFYINKFKKFTFALPVLASGQISAIWPIN